MSVKILVCDDEPFILKALTFIIRKEGHEVLEAKNGRRRSSGSAPRGRWSSSST